MILKPRDVSIWLSPIEAGVTAVIAMWALTLWLAWQNNRLMKRLVWLHEPRN